MLPAWVPTILCSFIFYSLVFISVWLIRDLFLARMSLSIQFFTRVPFAGYGRHSALSPFSLFTFRAFYSNDLSLHQTHLSTSSNVSEVSLSVSPSFETVSSAQGILLFAPNCAALFGYFWWLFFHIASGTFFFFFFWFSLAFSIGRLVEIFGDTFSAMNSNTNESSKFSGRLKLRDTLHVEETVRFAIHFFFFRFESREFVEIGRFSEMIVCSIGHTDHDFQ